MVRSTIVFVTLATTVVLSQETARPRARDLGLKPGVFEPGPHNAITDVGGVTVGHTTLNQGDHIRTGVTVVVPHGGNVFQDKVPGAVFVGNAFGKLAGSTQVEELGTIETPIALTNTLSVGAVMDGLVRWTLDQPGNGNVRSVNAVVGETNDGGLNDIRGQHVRPEHVLAAIKAAKSGPVEEGSVGAGTGTQAFGWKGGIGTASRQLPAAQGGYTLGVIVQSNFGGVLTMGGAPVGKLLGRYAYQPRSQAMDKPKGLSPQTPGGDKPSLSAEAKNAKVEGLSEDHGDGSCMIVVATDAPIDAHELKRVAARALFGLARTGSSFSNGSGDFAIAFSTAPELRTRFGAAAPQSRTLLPADGISPLFQAALEATEEAVYNSLLRATAVSSRSGKADALPIDRVREILRGYPQP
ncbi:MAG: P1 family peptidase [Acidobacteriota bacterium]|nr:P1 family peptidase [Acidobacteriota bacterium]